MRHATTKELIVSANVYYKGKYKMNLVKFLEEDYSAI